MVESHRGRKILWIAAAIGVVGALLVGLPGEALASQIAHVSDEGYSLQAYGGFVDVNEKDWYVKSGDLAYVVEHGLISGYGDGRFGPSDAVTRGQIVTILYRMAGEPKASAPDFQDVDYSQYYGDAIRWARAIGITTGYDGANMFGPNDSITREQLAVMLSNYASGVANVDTSSNCLKLDRIAGSSEVSSWARVAMGWAVDMGILEGDTVGGIKYVHPQNSAQRSQVAKMITALHRDVGVRLIGRHVLTYKGPEGVFYTDHKCYGGRDNPAVIDVKEIDPVTKTMRFDITCLIHAHPGLRNIADSTVGDQVVTIRNLQVSYVRNINWRYAYKADYDDLLVDKGSCSVELCFYTNDLLSLEVQSVYYADGRGSGWGVADTFELQL